jgi:hypothetical protein
MSRPRGLRIGGLISGGLLAALLLDTGPVAAGLVNPVSRCVPIRVSPCAAQNVHEDWPSAYAAANPGDTVILSPGTPPTRLRVAKRLIIRAHNGFVLSDEELDAAPETYVVHVAPGGEGTDLRLPVMVTTDDSGVARSAGGIFLEVDSDVLQGSSVYGPGCPGVESARIGRCWVPRDLSTIGILVNRGSGSKTMRVLGAAAERVAVRGFGVGIHVDNPAFHVTAYVTAEHNGTGLFQRWGQGQNFYGIWRYNDVAIEIQAARHNDTNSHQFACNGVALRSSRSEIPNPATGRTANGPHLEYNFHVVDTCGYGTDVEVEVAPRAPGLARVFLPDRTLDPGAYIQYSTRTVDGRTHPTWKTGSFDDPY